MKQESIDFSGILRQSEVDVFTLLLLRLLFSQTMHKLEASKTIKTILEKKTLITLSIEAEALEGSTKTKHVVQFVSNIGQQE